jgi:signal transduction histidine kinase
VANLNEWLRKNRKSLVDAAVARLSQDEALKSQVVESVGVFFDGLLNSVTDHNTSPLNEVLLNWVAPRSAATASEFVSFVPVLATLKEVTWEQILRSSSSDQSLSFLVDTDAFFTDAIIFISNLEGNTLLKEMRGQLIKAQADVERLDKSKSNFIAVASHELRTPLTLVEGYADMVANSPLLKNDPQIPLLIQGIESGTKRLKEIINDLIDVSLLDLKLMEFHFQPVWLHQILTAAERTVQKELVNRQLEFTIERNTITTSPTFADPDRLLQVMQKVMLNAVKYTPDGGTVVVQGRDLPGFTDIMVIDNGVGITQDNMPRIFDSFSALGDSSLHSSGKTKFKGGGPGLGLPIARGIMDAHGGTIWAESEGYDEADYPGSIFHIMVPMHTNPPDAPIWRSSKDISNE